MPQDVLEGYLDGLLAAGADPLIEDRNGRSAWSYVVARAEEGEWREYYQWVAEKLRPWI